MPSRIINLFMNRLRGRLQRRKPVAQKTPFSSIQIELTNNCNYRCPSCPQAIWRDPAFAKSPFDRPRGFMDVDLYKRIVDQAYEAAGEINFSFFGEPMMHPQFLECLDYLKDRPKGFRVVMNSNMSYATREIFEKLIEIKLTELRISLDAASSAAYDIVRPGRFFVDLDGRSKNGRRFEAICKKVDYWFDLPDHRPSRHVYTVSSKNHHELAAFIRRWQTALGDTDTILVKNVLTYGGKMNDPFVKPNACNVWSSNYLTIDWSGRLSPCNLDTNMELTVGRIGDVPLADLVASHSFKEVRRRSINRSITPCKTCIDGNNWSLNYSIGRDDPFDPTFIARYSEGCDLSDAMLETKEIHREPAL